MRFGPIPVVEAEGCVLAHSTRLNGETFKKGRILSSDDIAALEGCGLETVSVARLEIGDVLEDQAATRLAAAAANTGLRPDPAFTGRVNLFAAHAGVFTADAEAINSANRIDPSLTIATLPDYSSVEKGRMVATAKIIPFAVHEEDLKAAEKAVHRSLTLHPFKAHRVGLVATRLEHLKIATMDKTRRVLEDRLRPSGSTIISENRTAHEVTAVADAIRQQLSLGAELLALFGASAVVDRDDILPSAIEKAGGTLLHFGMPVDPGNLLLLGSVDGKPVIGAPGCARSPKENGFDWVLDRLLAGLTIAPEDITGMGIGGLLMEITSRPQPRAPKPARQSPKIAAVILAAGKSRRMGGPNKLLATLDGKSLIRRVAEAVGETGFAQRILVTGHMAEAIEQETADLGIAPVFNPDFEEGMASSIRKGIAELDDSIDAVMILLGDMPGIDAKVMDRIINTYRSSATAKIVLAAAGGKRGNPVLWDKTFFGDLSNLVGDIGARHLIGANPDVLEQIEIGDPARQDLDTPEALQAAGGKLPV
ncbi:NTP transferase domain-containing protein [Roseibium sp. RKSG952]|uniref:NTP transferase domain-containing protein n=1 Tax=Roseibium sp. RKSG952 TaxID=2529384 RepID=UPI0012BC922E|nr:molybdopterin-binding/glycosyltransferase family 2 protein [Roseibium sp. RKSG952]MTI00272.1 4-diphosphocytidyl-2C-methyl-D-erythritol kinase [Roseibium sp. RKSG952]